jgi:transmembrane sensor
MSDGVKTPESVKADAAVWLARLRSDTKTAADENAFRKWLGEDPSHIAAFEEMTDIWEALGSARRTPAETRAATTSLFSRRNWMMASGATAVAATVALFVRSRAEASVYETGVGEQHHVVLADGTQAFLDTSTRLRANFDGAMRVIELESGRCNFDVKGDDARPFVVNAADTKIVAGRTTLDVSRAGEDVTVVLIRGSAAVIGRGFAAEKPCVLKPGERLSLRSSGTQLDKPDLMRTLAWQTGQIVFENVTLAEAARELNRYSVIKLEADPSAAPLRISGVFHVGDNVAFAQLATGLLPVSIRVRADRVEFTKNSSREKKG